MHAAPIRIKFQSHTYEETDTPCLIVTNGTVFSPSGITIGLHLETSGMLYIYRLLGLINSLGGREDEVSKEGSSAPGIFFF